MEKETLAVTPKYTPTCYVITITMQIKVPTLRNCEMLFKKTIKMNSGVIIGAHGIV